MLDFIFCSVSEEDFKHESQNYRSFSVISNDFRNNSLQFSVKLFIAVQFLSLRTRTNDVFYVKMNAHCPLPCQSKKKNFFFREINCHLFLTLTLAWKIRENNLQWYVVVSNCNIEKQKWLHGFFRENVDMCKNFVKLNLFFKKIICYDFTIFFFLGRTRSVWRSLILDI